MQISVYVINLFAKRNSEECRFHRIIKSLDMLNNEALHGTQLWLSFEAICKKGSATKGLRKELG